MIYKYQSITQSCHRTASDSLTDQDELALLHAHDQYEKADLANLHDGFGDETTYDSFVHFKQHFLQSFDTCDENRDGMIAIPEMEACLNIQHGDTSSSSAMWTTEEVVDLVSTADMNKDGFLSLSELTQSHHVLTEMPGLDVDAHLEL
jgi:hypothetical protein